MSEVPARNARVAARVATPCPECPFNRNVAPGTLGGSPVETYIGQIYGPFVIACHMHINFQDPAWREMTKYSSTPQCAGAAVMRSNLGVADMMPAPIPRAQPNTTTVFADMAEFKAHHDQMPLTIAREYTTMERVSKLVRDQILRAREGRKP